MVIAHRSVRNAAVATAAAALLTAGAATATASAPSPSTPTPLTGIAKQQARQYARNARATQRAQGAIGARTATSGPAAEGDGNALEVADQAAEYANARTAPAGSVSAGALTAARRAAAALPRARTSLQEITDQRYNEEPAGYTDPYWSNAGEGGGLVGGRTTALAVDGSRTYYAGTADGGVWKSVDAGQHWKPIFDNQPTLSIGALLVTPNHDLWVGTGEANTNADSYLGTGVYRSTDGGRTFTRVGGAGLDNHQTYRLVDDGFGTVYAATSQGLYRHSDSTGAGAWTLVLKPDPNLSGSPYLTSMITDVVVRPGTHGQEVLAVDGWRNGSSYNGFYLSTTGGGAGSFQEITPTGDIDATDIGRTTLAYGADGTHLYAIVESPKALLAGGDTNLQGVYLSVTGDPAGPYTKIADSTSLGASGSALQNLDGYHVGIQSWYNQALAVDPKDPTHVWVSLEEVFQSTDAGATFTTASPYWNYGLTCPGGCPKTTHADQHALALTPNGTLVIGNDGGVYSRPMSDTGYGDWTDLNRQLHSLQYYDAAAGKDGNGYDYWGGLQDNGTSVKNAKSKVMIEPAGGDGGTVLVDPNNGQRAVGEYTDLTMYRTTDGGHTFTTISPECGYYTGADCDTSARFIAPFVADVHDPNHWVAAGNAVWDSAKGFATTCAGATCDWVRVHDFGTDANGGDNVGTALAVSGVTTYAAWVDAGANPGPAFQSGIDTNYGGTWHRIASPVLPNRYIAGLTVDPADPAHVYAVFNGYSRRWIPGGGIGVVFESVDGGTTWSNITGDLPDAPGDALVVIGGKLVLGTDVGVFVADESGTQHWTKVAGLPNASVNNVRALPGSSNTVVAALHGRGIWQITLK